MSAISHDLNLLRQNFLGQLDQARPELSTHQGYTQYWKAVEAEALNQSDFSQLDLWLRQLSQDRDKIRALEARAEQVSADPAELAMLQEILRLVLSLLEEVEKRVRTHRQRRWSVVAAAVFRAGPGMQVKASQDTEPNQEEQKSGERHRRTQQILDRDRRAAKAKPKAKPRAQKREKAP